MAWNSKGGPATGLGSNYHATLSASKPATGSSASQFERASQLPGWLVELTQARGIFDECRSCHEGASFMISRPLTHLKKGGHLPSPS
jgi:hypothetical protein